MTNTPNPPESESEGVQAPDTLTQTAVRSTCAKFLVRIFPPLLVATFIFTIVFGYSTQQKVQEEIHKDVEAYATALSQVLDDLMWTFQKEELTSALSTISSNPAMVGAELYDSQGQLYISHGETAFREEAGNFVIQKPIFKTKKDGSLAALGRLLIYYNYEHSNQHILTSFLGQVVRLLIVILVITVSAVFAYQQVIGKPLRILLQAIRMADTGDKPGKAEWESNDEIGEIIKAHNRMIHNLAEKESALADSEQRYRHLFDNALVGIFHMHRDGTFKDANKTIAEIMGFPSVKAMSGRNALDHYVDPKDRNRLWNILNKTGSISHFQMKLRREDDTEFWAEVSGRVSPDGTFNGILQDVTPQIEARKILEERDELHRAFFEENKAVMLLHDPLTSTIQFVNPAACLYYGYSEEELTSMTIRDLDCMTDNELFDELKQAATERRGYFKHVHTLKNGAKRDVEVFTGPISMSNRQLHYSIVHDVTEKRRLETKLERMATRDQLTGAFNRHAFFERGKEEIVRAERFERPMAVLMFDLDHFKQVNDTHGHAIGDEVLRVFALRCRADLRQSDIFARLGGEEFAAVLVEASEERALEVAERIRQIAETKPIPTEVGEVTITTSIGVTPLMDDDSMAEILKRADLALYLAKHSGRNKVCKA